MEGTIINAWQVLWVNQAAQHDQLASHTVESCSCWKSLFAVLCCALSANNMGQLQSLSARRCMCFQKAV
jgi:hypothetical protein